MNQEVTTTTSERERSAAATANDALGSFNSWMRLITGILFAIGLVWFPYPYLEDAFAGMQREIETKFNRAGLSL